MTKYKIAALATVHGFLFGFLPHKGFAQAGGAEGIQGMAGFETSNLWDLVGQAGFMQYPIYGVLIVGVFLISLKVFELIGDKKKNSKLRHTQFQQMSIRDIKIRVTKESDHMLSRLMAKLLNVFLTNRNADYLHDEISNYYSNEQLKYTTFKNRIDFLSDTAGALGLLGTVWGMFIVFSSGALEKDVILAGMGLALMSTLLGLIVSITLNFFSTITEGYFAKHLETIAGKADELRFRLIELSDNSYSAAGAGSGMDKISEGNAAAESGSDSDLKKKSRY